MTRLLHRLRAFFRKNALDRELNAEMAAHIALATEDNLRAGMSPGEARRRALARFGGITQARQQHRDSRGLPMLDILLNDLRYTFRTLRRDLGFTSVAVLILALGIGANVVVFSVVNTLLLRPLPFTHPEQLVNIAGNYGQLGLSDTTYRIDWWEAYQRNNQTMQNVTGYVPYFAQLGQSKLMNHGTPLPVAGAWVLTDFFQTLGVQPAMGRLFTYDEGVKGGHPAIILTYPFWQRRFNSDPHLLGQSITLDKDTYTVVGILPASFDFGSVFAPGEKMDYFIPVIPDNVRNWGHMLTLIGRMKPGITVAQAQAEANSLFPHLRDTLKLDGDTDYKTTITGLKEHVAGQLRRSLIVLWCAVGLILLIVVVNLSNLLLARAAARSKEFALRLSLGSGRGRLIRQLLTESLILSGMGAVLGLGLAYATTYYLAHQGSVALPLMSSIRVDTTALLWTVTLALAVGILFGLVPGLKVSAGSLQAFLKDGGHSMSSGRQHERLRTMLVVSEIALACVLIVAAGLLLRSFLHVMDVDLGFQPDHGYTIKMDYNPNLDNVSNAVTNGEKRAVTFRQAIDRLQAIPGVQSVGITDSLPLEKGRSWDLHARNRPSKPGENNDAFVYLITPGYFQSIGMHLRAGRDFTWTDLPKSEHVIIINQAAARREWPGQDPIGKLAYGIGDGNTRVVGVIDDVRETSAEAPSEVEAYVPVTQNEPAKAQVVLRSTLPAETLAPSVMQVLRELHPAQAAEPLLSLESWVDHSTSPRRFFALLVGLFAALGLILASLGIYGVISYNVTRQTQEIGIRMALGATRETVQRSILVRTLRLAALGLCIGAAASFAVARAIRSMLFGTQPTDPVTFAAMVALLLAVALLAGYLPARRASRIDPMSALRSN
jgi:predicted permease